MEMGTQFLWWSTPVSRRASGQAFAEYPECTHCSADLPGGLPGPGTFHNKGLLFILGRNTDIS